MTRATLISISVATLSLSRVVEGQVCTGLASFSQGPVQVSGTIAFDDNAKTFLGGLGFGGKGAFGQLSVGTTSFDQIDGSSFLLGAGVGYQVPLGQPGVAQVCPIASFGLALGPNNLDVFGDGSLVVDLKETDLTFGVSLGVVASRDPKAQIIPNASLGLVHATVKVTDDVSGTSNSQSETFGVLALNLGFVFSDVFNVRPGVQIPFGLDGASTAFGATVGLNFGRKSR